MLALVALTAFVLSASPDADQPLRGKLPYPAPKHIQVTEKTKCDWGTIVAVEPSRHVMRGKTLAGVATYNVGPEVKVFSDDGKLMGGLAVLSIGQKFRVYYLLDSNKVFDEGNKVLEIDIE
jgi:hypothetical protein